MTRESLAELDAISVRYQNRPEVLQLRLHHLMRDKEMGLGPSHQSQTLPGRP